MFGTKGNHLFKITSNDTGAFAMRGYFVVSVLFLIGVHSVFGQAWSIRLDSPKSSGWQVSLKGDDFDSEESDLDDGTNYDQDDAIHSDVATRPKILGQKGAKPFMSERLDIESNSNSDWNSEAEDETVLHEMYHIR
jgi:hypothetical protein